MDPNRPSTSSHGRGGEVLSPRKKRKAKPLCQGEKSMILNAYKYVSTEAKNKCEFEVPKKEECVIQTAQLLGISRASVFNVLKEHKENATLTSPSKSGPKYTYKEKLDDFTFSAIRRKVHQFFYRNESPTLDKILQEINAEPDLPTFSRSTLYKIMKELKFKYITRRRRSALTDRDEIILWRDDYLHKIKQYRSEGRCIYYQDETWINEGHTENKQWVDTNIQSSRQAFLEGLSTGLKGPTGKGRRLVISHIGSEEGFVDDGLLMFEAKKGLDDYHKEMNSQVYENWLKTILPKLKPNSVLVIDNAPYHSRRQEALPTSEWRKARLQEWLKEKNIPFDDRMLKAKLVEIARKARQSYVRHVVDEMAAERGVSVLRLPPYHCELNPIELVWAQVKGYVAKNNRTYKMNEVKQLFEEGLKQVTPQRWSDCIAHVIKIEEEMTPLGHVVESIAENFIIEVGSNTDSESNKSSSERTDSE